MQPNDPATLIWSGVILAAVAMLAAFLPARRASRLDPTVALREE
jgi:ABC-type antimicrobial peptide transport system permease subunit